MRGAVLRQEKSVEAIMYDDDRDALAAEYVLGTLSAEEREQAEALLAIDHGFAETVRLWEHRLGELNVMVEAVELFTISCFKSPATRSNALRVEVRKWCGNKRTVLL